MANYEVDLVKLKDLGYATRNADHFEWRIRTHLGLTIARSRTTYEDAELAVADAQRAVDRLVAGSAPRAAAAGSPG